MLIDCNGTYARKFACDKYKFAAPREHHLVFAHFDALDVGLGRGEPDLGEKKQIVNRRWKFSEPIAPILG